MAQAGVAGGLGDTMGDVNGAGLRGFSNLTKDVAEILASATDTKALFNSSNFYSNANSYTAIGVKIKPLNSEFSFGFYNDFKSPYIGYYWQMFR